MISIDFIDRWQTLIGSALGLFFAVIIPVIGYFVKGIIGRIDTRKESIRRAEIAFSQTLNHILTSADQLQYFIERVDHIIREVKKISNPKTFSLQETNFPPIISIYFDQELPRMKFKSYYLHNKILIIEYLTRWANSTIIQFREDFDRIIKKNEMMVEKMHPEEQRRAYIESLEGFIEVVKGFYDSFSHDNAKSIVQAKVYNLKLMQNYYWTIWKFEGTRFKYFKNKKEMQKYSGSLSAVDRINDLMEKESKEMMQEAQNRQDDVSQRNATPSTPPHP